MRPGNQNHNLSPQESVQSALEKRARKANLRHLFGEDQEADARASLNRSHLNYSAFGQEYFISPPDAFYRGEGPLPTLVLPGSTPNYSHRRLEERNRLAQSDRLDASKKRRNRDSAPKKAMREPDQFGTLRKRPQLRPPPSYGASFPIQEETQPVTESRPRPPSHGASFLILESSTPKLDPPGRMGKLFKWLSRG